MPGNPLTDPNWAPDLADQIAGFVGNIREKTTNNAIKVARGIVFGLLGGILGIVALCSSSSEAHAVSRSCTTSPRRLTRPSTSATSPSVESSVWSGCY
jgi:hypothetical protein